MSSFELLRSIEFLTQQKKLTPNKDFEYDLSSNSFRLHNQFLIQKEDFDENGNLLIKIKSIDHAISHLGGLNNDFFPILSGSEILDYASMWRNLRRSSDYIIKIKSFNDIMPTDYVHGHVNLSNFQPEDRLFNFRTRLIDFRLNSSNDPRPFNNRRFMGLYGNAYIVSVAISARQVVLTDINADEFPYVHGNISVSLCMDIKKLKEKVIELITPRMTTMSSISIFDAQNKQIYFSSGIQEHNDMVRGKLSMEEFEEKKIEIANL